MTDTFERLKATLADRYAIERELGSGGMATVYLAEDLKHERKVAVKVLRPDLAAALGSERFLREIKIAAQLHHPHILPLHDSGEADGFLYYVMPYEEGQSLREKLAKEGELPVTEAVRLLRDVVDALAHAHKQGVVHRDIKPDNVMLSGRHALVTDFGVAKAVSEATGRQQLTTAGVALGTPAYMAPEQAVADPHIDHRADIYAVGALAYELLTGRPPFTGTTAQEVLSAHVTETAEPVTKYRETVPPPLATLVMTCLEKKPADRWQSAEELLLQLEALATPSGGITPTDTRPVAATKPRTRRLAISAGVVAVVAVAAIAGWQFRPRAAESAPDPNVLAVAPFDVLGPGLDMWREGLAEMLAHSLDGAGTLRTISPSVVFRNWSGRADPASAMQLGTNVGSGLAVYGRLAAFGSDSVRANATLFDVESGTPIRGFELSEGADRIVALADSLAVRLMEELSRARSLGAVPLRSLGSSSPRAIAAFLRGEQHYRGFRMDSAAAAYREAIEIDGAFALAYNRLGSTAWWGGLTAGDTLFLRAAELNHGLAARESLLITVDSIYAATNSYAPDSASWTLFERLFGTLETADRLYPNDVQIRYRLGEAHIHRGWAAGFSAEEALEAFQRAVELDSTFAPAHPHVIHLKLWLEGAEPARDAIQAYLSLGAAGDDAEAAVVARELLTADRGRGDLDALLDTVPLPIRRFALFTMQGVPDSGEVALELARHPQLAPARLMAAATFAYRGHLREAYNRLGVALDPNPVDSRLLSELALLHAVPRDSVDAVLSTWEPFGDRDHIRYAFLAWWAGVGDTASIQDALRRWASALEEDTTSTGTQAWLRFNLASGGAWLALARRDTTSAQQLFDPASRYRCNWCYREKLAHARLLAADDRDREAVEVLRGAPTVVFGLRLPGEVVWALERARVNERLGNTERAIRDYGLVATVWHNADDVLQPFVAESREALQRLTGEPRQ